MNPYVFIFEMFAMHFSLNSNIKDPVNQNLVLEVELSFVPFTALICTFLLAINIFLENQP